MAETATVGTRPHRLVAEWWPRANRVSLVCVRCRRQVICKHVDDGIRSFLDAWRCGGS